ncbi:TetR/AcrR family transcriptional regulator [Hyphomicrobiales bacterium]|nr:TetR/AcrR family transcriptional regulator [Hyphomicrobiales bacterium]
MIKSEKKIEFSGKRELTKTNNRSLIIASGINVFVDKGVAEATVRDIIRATGLASGTFYNYFKSKEEVLVAIFDDFASEIGENIRSQKHKIPKDFEDFLRIKISTFLNYINNKPEIYLIMSNNHNLVTNFSIATPQIILEIDYLKEEVVEGINEGVFPKIDVDLFALVTRPVVDTIAQEMILQKKLSIEECTDRCVNFLLKGFLGSK